MRRSAALVALCIAIVCLAGSLSAAPRPLEVLCAPALRTPLEEMLANYRKATGARTSVSYDGSNIILGQLRLRPHGDLFVPADRFYTDEAVRSGLAESPKVIAYLVPVIMVQKGNPFRIARLTDLLNRKLRVGLVDERTAAIGKASAAVFRKNKIDVKRVNVVYHATKVDELANAIKLKSIDAAIVWQPVAIQYPKDSDIIGIPASMNTVVPVSAAVVKSSNNKAAARQFLAYITSKDGKAILSRFHYPTTAPKK